MEGPFTKKTTQTCLRKGGFFSWFWNQNHLILVSLWLAGHLERAVKLTRGRENVRSFCVPYLPDTDVPWCTETRSCCFQPRKPLVRDKNLGMTKDEGVVAKLVLFCKYDNVSGVQCSLWQGLIQMLICRMVESFMVPQSRSSAHKVLNVYHSFPAINFPLS